MRNLLLVIALVAAPPVSSAVAGQPQTQKSGKPSAPDRQLRPKAGAGNSCAAFGPGFLKAPGTDTCVKIGGGVDIGVGGSR